MPSALFEAVDRGDVRMVQRREHFRFALKARQPIVVSGERGGQDLDRDLALQLRVGRAIHLAHPAFADRARDFVDAETGAGSEGQSVADYMGGSGSMHRDCSVKRRSVDRFSWPGPGGPRAAARTRLLQPATLAMGVRESASPSVQSPSCRGQGGVRARQWREHVVGGASGSGPDWRAVNRAVLGTPPRNPAALMRFSRRYWPRPWWYRGRGPSEVAGSANLVHFVANPAF